LPVVVSTTAILPLTAPAAVGVLRIPALAAVAFVKNKAAKAACLITVQFSLIDFQL
jgi:hypothetical protein